MVSAEPSEGGDAPLAEAEQTPLAGIAQTPLASVAQTPLEGVARVQRVSVATLVRMALFRQRSTVKGSTGGAKVWRFAGICPRHAWCATGAGYGGGYTRMFGGLTLFALAGSGLCMLSAAHARREGKRP